MARPSQRDQLLDVAMDLFASFGSRGTSLAAVARRSGMTTPATTHHFGSKQGLLLAIVEELDRRDEAALEVGSGTGIGQLRSLGRWANRMVADDEVAHLAKLRAVLASEALDPDYPARDAFVDRRRRQRDTILAVLRTGRADGTVRSDADLDTVAAEIMATFQGAQTQWLLDPAGVDLVALVDGYLDRLAADLDPTTHHQGETDR